MVGVYYSLFILHSVVVIHNINKRYVVGLYIQNINKGYRVGVYYSLFILQFVVSIHDINKGYNGRGKLLYFHSSVKHSKIGVYYSIFILQFVLGNGKKY